MHIPVIPPPPPPHMSKPSMPERVHSSGKIKKKQHQQLMQQDEEWKLPTPPLASPGISGTPDGYTDVSGPGEVMAASLSESNFLPMRESVEDDESDRWSVLSTGPVDRQWTMVFEEKDEVV